MKIHQTVIKRENGDEDLLILCDGCIKTITDYTTIVSRKICAGRCERCGASPAAPVPAVKSTHVACEICGSRISITKDGLTRVHRKRGQAEQCSGSQRRAVNAVGQHHDPYPR